MSDDFEREWRSHAVCGRVLFADRQAVSVRPPGTSSLSFSPSQRASRTRRRGPRSDAATFRRSRARRDPSASVGELPRSQPCHHELISPLDGLGEARHTPSIDFSSFTIDHVNIRGFTSHRAELEGHIKLNGDKPHLLAINETFLTRAVESATVSGYVLVSRRDRQDESGWGGVAAFALPSVAPYVTLLEQAQEFEGSWHVIHSDVGPVLLCVWYRPPAPGELEPVRAFVADWERLSPQYIGTIVVGDLNLHHIRWLRHSSHCSVEGALLYRFCCDNGFKQLVRKPTREGHLLDLVLSDMNEALKTTVLPKIADHNVVRTRFALQVPQTTLHRREVFLYKSADWNGMRRFFRNSEWSWIDQLGVDDACEKFVSLVLDGVREHVPTCICHDRTTSHPWLNQKCLDAIEAKRNVEGTCAFPEAARRCSDVLLEEFFAFNRRMRDKLRKIPRGSKAWWRLSRQLADRSNVASSIPALKSSSGDWALTPEEKANFWQTLEIIWTGSSNRPKDLARP